MSYRCTMRNLCVLIILCVYQVASACQFNGQLAVCDFQYLRHVPALPSHITRLSLSNNYIGEVNETSFDGLEQLEVLHLGFQLTNKLIIKNNAFRGLSNLKYLHLGGNTALILEPNAFVGLTHLQNLVLLHNGLDESILKGEYLQPLVSLETLDLYGNKIRRVQPALFFQNMTKLQEINLTLNSIDSLCEKDLLGFHGKDFNLLKLSSISLRGMDTLNWNKCGNPFRNMSVRVLDLSRNPFNVEKTRLFLKATEGTNIHHLILSSNVMGRSIGHNNLKDPDMQTFTGLKNSSLKILDLSKNSIFSLEFSVFSPLKEVIEIILASNNINKIQRNAFLGLVHLEKLNLSNNLIGEIYPYTFANLPNVVQIDLSYNHIGVVVYKSFSGLPNLAILNLFGNAITALHTFATISSLQLLQLGDNKLTSLYGLSAFANTSLIGLSENRLRDLKDLYEILATLPSVQLILLRDNMFSVCHPQHSVPLQNNLMHLDLQLNALQLIWAEGACLDVFHNLGNLQYLALNKNSLRSPLPKDIFKGLISLKIMDLSFNLLTYLPHDIFPENLEHLDLSHNILGSPNPNTFHMISVINLGTNPFLCDCRLENFLTWLNETNITFVGTKESLTCEFPEELLGERLLNLDAQVCVDNNERIMLQLRLNIFMACSVILTLLSIGGVALGRLRGVCFTFYKRTVARIVEGPRRAPPLGGFKYDAYLCFSQNDFKWVEHALLKRLDSNYSDHNLFRCCFEARDFMPGENQISNIRDAIWCSRKTICVVSKEFLKDGWCIEAFNLAQSRMLEELKEVLIVVVVGRMPHYKLMKFQPIRAFVNKQVYLRWPEDSQDMEWFYDQLTLNILQEKGAKKQCDIKLQTISQNVDAISPPLSCGSSHPLPK